MAGQREVSAGHSSRALQLFNQRRVLRTFFEQGTLSRREIGAMTGLSKPTVSQVLTRLESAGIVVCAGVQTEPGPGPNPQLYRLNGAAVHVAGVDLGNQRVVARIADLTGRVVGGHAVFVDQLDPAGSIRDVLEAATTAAGTRTGALLHVVIGVPAMVDPRTGILSYGPCLPPWATTDLLQRMRSILRVPITLERDVNLAAIAEQHHGRAVGRTDFALLRVSAGVSLALVIGGSLQRGATGAAGGIGHLGLLIDPKRGSRAAIEDIQDLAWPQAVARLAAEHGLTGDNLVELVRRAERSGGDEFLDALAERFAAILATVAAVVDPQLIVLGGDVFRAGGESFRARISRRLADFEVPQPPLAASEVDGNAVGGGALRLALDSARTSLLGLGLHDCTDTLRETIGAAS